MIPGSPRCGPEIEGPSVTHPASWPRCCSPTADIAHCEASKVTKALPTDAFLTSSGPAEDMVSMVRQWLSGVHLYIAPSLNIGTPDIFPPFLQASVMLVSKKAFHELGD